MCTGTADPATRWIVVRQPHVDGHWYYSGVIRELIGGREPVEVPARASGNQVQILIYDRLALRPGCGDSATGRPRGRPSVVMVLANFPARARQTRRERSGEPLAMSFLISHAITRLAAGSCVARATQFGALLVQSADFRSLCAHRDRDRDGSDSDMAA